MAHKCSACGSADTSTGLHTYTCLTCGAVSEYEPQPDVGRIPNPDGPATYATDPAGEAPTVRAVAAPEPEPVDEESSEEAPLEPEPEAALPLEQ